MALNMNRRNFLQAAAATASLAALAGCSNSSEGSDAASTADASSAPAADKYPIDAEEWGSGTPKYTTEVVGSDRNGEGWTRVVNEDGATLGVMDAEKLIQVDGYAFKDLNGNGKLDLYEDWRQAGEDRAAALAESMEAEDIFPLMFNTSFFDTTYPLSEQELGFIADGARTTCNNTGYGPEEVVEAVKWNNAVQSECESTGSYGIPHLTAFDPYFVFGFPGNLSVASSFDPEMARKTGECMAKNWRAVGKHLFYGPQIGIATDPRWVRFSGAFSEDPALARDMAQAYIDSLQSTYDESGEDQGWGDDSIICQTKHFPGGGAAEGGRYDHADSGKYNVYPGGGFRTTFIPFTDGALNLPGKTGMAGSVMPDYNIYVGEGTECGAPVGVAFDEYKSGILRGLVGDNLVSSDWDITSNFDTPGQLREGGSNHAWGVEDLTPAEREAKAIEAGAIDQFGGEFELGIIADAYEIMKKDLGDDAALERMRLSAKRVFVAMNRVSLFDNPYLSRESSEAVVTDEDIAGIAREVSQKAVILLKNKGGVIKERSEKPTVYLPMKYTPASSSFFGGDVPASVGIGIDEDVAAEHFNVVTDTISDTADENNLSAADIVRASADQIAACDFAVVSVSSPSTGNGYDDQTQTYLPISLQYREYKADGPNVRQTSLSGNPADGSAWCNYDSFEGVEIENRSYYGQSVTATNEDDLDRVLEVKELLPEGMPLVLVVTASNPMCFGEVEPSADAIVFTWSDNLEDDIRYGAVAGEFEPTGLLPAQMPKDMDAVEAQCEDLPRDMEVYEDSEGNEYDFGFGLNWSGVISDDRTAKYCVDPLTDPENVEF